MHPSLNYSTKVGVASKHEENKKQTRKEREKEERRKERKKEGSKEARKKGSETKKQPQDPFRTTMDEAHI